MLDSTAIQDPQLKASKKPRQSASSKANHLEHCDKLIYRIFNTVMDENGVKVGQRQRAAVAHKVGLAYTALAGDVRKGLLDRSRGMRVGCGYVINGRHGWPCNETGAKAAGWFDTLTDIEAPIMAMDRKETADKAWRTLRSMLPAYCDLMGREWVVEQLEAKRAHFDRIVANSGFEGRLVPPLMTRPYDIAHAHQITLQDLRAYGANRCGLTSINPETPEQVKASKRAAQAKRRLDQGMTPQKDRTLTKDKAAYAKRHKTTVYKVTQRMEAGTLTREELREPDDVRKNVCGPNLYIDATDFGEPADALVIHPATVADATIGWNASQELR